MNNYMPTDSTTLMKGTNALEMDIAGEIFELELQ